MGPAIRFYWEARSKTNELCWAAGPIDDVPCCSKTLALLGPASSKTHH